MNSPFFDVGIPNQFKCLSPDPSAAGFWSSIGLFPLNRPCSPQQPQLQTRFFSHTHLVCFFKNDFVAAGVGRKNHSQNWHCPGKRSERKSGYFPSPPLDLSLGPSLECVRWLPLDASRWSCWWSEANRDSLHTGFSQFARSIRPRQTQVPTWPTAWLEPEPAW